MEGESSLDFKDKMLVFTGCSNRSTDSEHQSKKMGIVRSRFEKNAIRVCGDWSEQLSSKGKVYFYNCITEVSQWQKPSEWNLPDLEHNELIKVLSQRDTLESSVKRPRLMCTTAESVRKDNLEVARISPKKSKTYEHVDSEKRYLADDRVCLQRNLCGYIPKNRPPLRQRGYRESPKIDCNGSSHYTSQYSNSSNSRGKRDPSVTMQRPALADDMEISPNSSPMSGGSSPLGYGNSHSPKRVKCRPGNGPRVLRRAACSDTKIISRDNTDKSGNSSHTLRQLIDAIRDSIGGLLDQSPCSTSNQKSRASGSANGLHFKQVPNSNEKVSSSSVNSIRTSRTVDQAVKALPAREMNTQAEFNDKRYLHSPGNCSTQPEASALPSTSERLNVQDKGMSGLVSTLSTLVSLIGTRNSSSQSGGGDSSTHTPTQTSTLRQSFTRPHLLQQPLQHRFGHQTISSPLTPSPATPSAATGASSGGGSSGGTLTNSISSAGTFNCIQQPDDASAGPERVGTAKFRVSASTSSHDLNSPCNIQRSVSPPRPGCLEIRDGHRLESIPTDELSQERQKSLVEASKTMDYSQTDKEFRTRMSTSRYLPIGSASPTISSTGRQNTAASRLYSPSTSQSTLHKSSPVTGLPNSSSLHPRDTVGSSIDKRYERHRSPDKLYPSLDAAETQAYVEPSLNLQYRDIAAERLEGEAQTEAKRFDRLHSVLYGELSAESKILRALVRISEAKLAIHKEKQSSLQDLMDTIECRRQLPNPSLPDDAI